MKRITFIAGLFLAMTGTLWTAQAHAANWLFRNGKSKYQIVLPSDASESEKTAASPGRLRSWSWPASCRNTSGR